MATGFHLEWFSSSAHHPAWGPGRLAILPTALPWVFWPTKMVWTILLLHTNNETENKALFALS